MVLKNLTPEERQAARQKALDARNTRAEVKSDYTAGKISFTEVLDRAKTDEAVARMRVEDLLLATRGVGEVRAAALMDECQISPSRRLRGLGRRQLETLLIKLPATASEIP